LVMLAYLRRRWCLSGREGFGFLSPSHLASSAGFGAFVEVKRLFSTAPDAKKRRRKGVTGMTGRATGRWIGRGWRVRSAHPACRGSTHRRVRSVTGPARPVKLQRSCETREVDQTRWRVRSRSIGRVRSCVGAYWNRPDAGTVASGQFKRRIRSRGQQRESTTTGRCDRVQSVQPARLVSTQAAATCS
jgi:hypothetical protein